MNILMPQLGETVAEGKITKWFKSAGDAVKPGDNLFEIETDKVSMEVPATEAGVLSEIRVPEGEVVPVGAVVGVIGDAGAATAAPAAKAEAPKTVAAPVAASLASARALPPAQTPQQPIKLDPFFEVRTPARNYGPAKLSGGITVTPLARRLAGEAGIDLSRLRGSGPHGRIVARDIETVPRPSLDVIAKATVACFWSSLLPNRSRRSSIRRATWKCRLTECAEPSRRGSSWRNKRSRISI